jgi:polyhydroxyalkanoate synthesis regulator protein
MITIKRYKNNKYYYKGEYITLDEIHNLLDKNNKIVVLCHGSGEDFTKKALIELHKKLARELDTIKSNNILLKIKELENINDIGE